MTPGCIMMPSIHHVRTLTLPRPASPPPYSSPSPVYCPDPTPSPASTNMPTPGGNSPGNCPSGSADLSTGHLTPEHSVFKRQTVLTARKVPKNHESDTKLWQQIQSELSK